MNNYNFLGYVNYDNLKFAVYRDSLTNQKMVQMEMDYHPQKKELEALVLDKITTKDGRGYLKKKFSLKKLFFFGGILACFSKPTILAQASEYKEIENLPIESNQMTDALAGLADSISYTINNEIMDFEKEQKEDIINNLSQVAIANLENLTKESTLKRELKNATENRSLESETQSIIDASKEMVQEVVNSIPVDSYDLGSALPSLENEVYVDSVSLKEGLTYDEALELNKENVSSVADEAMNQIENQAKNHINTVNNVNDLVNDTLEKGLDNISFQKESFVDTDKMTENIKAALNNIETVTYDEALELNKESVSSVADEAMNQIENQTMNFNQNRNVTSELVSNMMEKSLNTVSLENNNKINANQIEVLSSEVLENAAESSLNIAHINNTIKDTVTNQMNNIKAMDGVKQNVDISSALNGINGLTASKISEQQKMYLAQKEKLEQAKKNISNMVASPIEKLSVYDFDNTPNFNDSNAKEVITSAATSFLNNINTNFASSNTEEFVTYNEFFNTLTNTVNDVASKTISDTNVLNEELINKEIILYGKEEVDYLFKNKRITKEGVLKILKENKKIPDSYKPLFQNYIENVYNLEQNPDMRLYALNLGRVKVVTDESANMSYYSPENNEMLIHIKGDQILLSHENEHMRNLIAGDFCIDNDVQKAIKVTGNSCINNYIGSGMREAYTVSRNRQRGNDDKDYEVLYSYDQILNGIFPNEMGEIETYNDYEKLKKLFISYGLTEEDYANFIATTDIIGKCYQEDKLELDQSLVRQGMMPLTEIIVNKCLKEDIEVESLIESIIHKVPQGIWKKEIESMLQNCNFYLYAQKSQRVGR